MTDFELRERVRSATYYHLARLLELPDAFLEAEDVFGRLVSALEPVNPEAAGHARALAEAWVSDGRDLVRRDHLKLFVGPEHLLAPPYGSVYLDGQRELMGPSTADLVRLLAAAGLQKAETLKDAPDHVRVEFDAMHVMIDRTLEAIAADDWSRAQQLIKVQATLLQNHLSRWVTPFAKLVRTGAGTAYHRHLADLLEAFVRQEYTEDAPAMVDEFHALQPAAVA